MLIVFTCESSFVEMNPSLSCSKTLKSLQKALREIHISFHIWNCKLYKCNVQWIDRYEVCKANMRRRWIQFGDLRIVKSSFVIIVLSPDPLSKSLFRFVTKIIQFPFTEFLSFKIPFYICDEKYTSYQKALFKVPKICNINVWIEMPSPLGTFPKIHPIW